MLLGSAAVLRRYPFMVCEPGERHDSEFRNQADGQPCCHSRKSGSSLARILGTGSLCTCNPTHPAVRVCILRRSTACGSLSWKASGPKPGSSGVRRQAPPVAGHRAQPRSRGDATSNPERPTSSADRWRRATAPRQRGTPRRSRPALASSPASDGLRSGGGGRRRRSGRARQSARRRPPEDGMSNRQFRHGCPSGVPSVFAAVACGRRPRRAPFRPSAGQLGCVLALVPFEQVQKDGPGAPPEHEGGAGRQAPDLMQGDDGAFADLFAVLPALGRTTTGC